MEGSTRTDEQQAAAKAEYEKLLNTRAGGTYVPPARLRALQAQITDKTSKEYQRMAWEALKKSINGLINKVNVSNIKHIVPELFGENLVRGRGLFCRSIMKAQAASLPFTPIYAAMVAIVNTKLPKVENFYSSASLFNSKRDSRGTTRRFASPRRPSLLIYAISKLRAKSSPRRYSYYYFTSPLMIVSRLQLA